MIWVGFPCRAWLVSLPTGQIEEDNILLGRFAGPPDQADKYEWVFLVARGFCHPYKKWKGYGLVSLTGGFRCPPNRCVLWMKASFSGGLQPALAVRQIQI